MQKFRSAIDENLCTRENGKRRDQGVTKTIGRARCHGLSEIIQPRGSGGGKGGKKKGQSLPK